MSILLLTQRQKILIKRPVFSASLDKFIEFQKVGDLL